MALARGRCALAFQPEIRSLGRAPEWRLVHEACGRPLIELVNRFGLCFPALEEFGQFACE